MSSYFRAKLMQPVLANACADSFWRGHCGFVSKSAESYSNGFIAQVWICPYKSIDFLPIENRGMRVAFGIFSDLRSQAPEMSFHKSHLLALTNLHPPFTVQIPVRILPGLR